MSKSPAGKALLKNNKSNSFMGKSSAKLKEFTSGSKITPSKVHYSMANMLTEQRLMDSKESFARTVLTARQESNELPAKIRQKEDHALTTRNHFIPNGTKVGLD